MAKTSGSANPQVIQRTATYSQVSKSMSHLFRYGFSTESTAANIQASRERDGIRQYESVVTLVRSLGEAATGAFLDDLSPYLDAVQLREENSEEELARFLHSYAVSAVLMKQAGGIERLQSACEPAS